MSAARAVGHGVGGGAGGCALALAALLAGGCPSGPQAVFDARAAPVLERSCATLRCHGVAAGEPLPAVGLFLHVDAMGRLADPAAARQSCLARVTTTAPAHLSTLVRVPLASEHGGGPHQGGDLFASRADPGAAALTAWIDAEPEGTGGEDIVLTELEQRFAADALPTLAARCGIAGCHGPDDVATTAIPALRDPASDGFAPRDVRRARRGLRKFLDLWGADARQSRLFRKAIGGHAGLRHRGGPGTFFPEAPGDDALGAPALAGVLAWARAERAAVGVEDGREPRGILYVREPAQARAPYRIEPGAAGADLYLLPWPLGSEPPERLTDLLRASVGDSPLELRDPASAHDGRRIAIAVRPEGDERFAIHEIDLDTRLVRRLSPTDAPGSFVSPTYGPDGRLVASWDGHGEPGDDGAGIPPELVALDEDGTMERLTWTRAPEVRPGVLAAGKTRGMIVFGIRRAGPVGTEGVLFRFPPCHDPTLHGEPEYHVQFGASVSPRALHVARDLPDGRQILVVLATTEEPDDHGALAILDRSLGPAARAGDAPSVPGPIDALVTIDEAPRWRDPAPLPDGRILASTDRDRTEGEDALVVIEVRDGAAGPSLGSVETVVEEPGFAIRGGAIVIARPLEDDEHAPVIRREGRSARLALRDAAILEALYGRPEPSGVRPLRNDLFAVRALVPADAESARGLGARVLGEVPLAADHSAELAIPARTPVLLQFLDARGMVVGQQLDRWFYGEGDELVPAGTNPATYALACATCHGALSGEPEDVATQVPDVLTAASVTLSTHADRDRRRPLPLTDLASREPSDASFTALVEPILSARCVRCHSGDEPAGALSLEPGEGVRFAAAYEALLAGPVDASRRARRSRLVERLLGEELEADGSPLGRCPPEGLAELDVRNICRWIEAGASYRELPDAR